MQSLDTNVLLRLILLDDAKLLVRVRKLLSEHDQFAVSDAALMEVVFVLVGSTYGYTRAEITFALDQLLRMPRLELNRPVFRRVLQRYADHSAVSFADLYLEATAYVYSNTPLYTLDKKLARQLPHAELVT